MDYHNLTLETLPQEHICCAMSGAGVQEKKQWLKQRMEEGLVFRKGDVRGKVFIEYLPSEAAWIPVEINNWLVIDCLWASGKYKGCGYGKELLQACIQDAIDQHKDGVYTLSSLKKQPYLSDPKFFIHHGFQVCDERQGYTLLALPFTDGVALPTFMPHVLQDTQEQGFSLYYSCQCPFALTYGQALQTWMQEAHIPFTLHPVTTKEEARACPSPVTHYALYQDGHFLTHEILSQKKAERLIADYVGKGY